MSWYFFKDKNIKTGNAKVDLTVKTTKYTCTTMHTINISDASNMMVTSYYLSFQIVTFRWNLNTFFNVTGHQRFPQTSVNISTRVTLKSIHLIKKTKQEIYLKFCTQNQNSFSFLICPLVPFFLQNQCSKISQKCIKTREETRANRKNGEILSERNNIDAKKQCPFVRVLWHYDTYLSTWVGGPHILSLWQKGILWFRTLSKYVF